MIRGDILMAYTLHGRWGFNSDYSFKEDAYQQKEILYEKLFDQNNGKIAIQ